MPAIYSMEFPFSPQTDRGSYAAIDCHNRFNLLSFHEKPGSTNAFDEWWEEYRLLPFSTGVNEILARYFPFKRHFYRSWYIPLGANSHLIVLLKLHNRQEQAIPSLLILNFVYTVSHTFPYTAGPSTSTRRRQREETEAFPSSRRRTSTVDDSTSPNLDPIVLDMDFDGTDSPSDPRFQY